MNAQRQRGPRFFWQGTAILLPVAIMAAFAFWAILRQRNAVEQDARERAREIVQSLPDFGLTVAYPLTDAEASKSDWLYGLRDAHRSEAARCRRKIARMDCGLLKSRFSAGSLAP